MLKRFPVRRSLLAANYCGAILLDMTERRRDTVNRTTELERPGLSCQGGLWLEGEAGLAVKCSDMAAPSLYAVQLVAHCGGELGCGAGGEVAQAAFFITDKAPSTERSRV
jgi:hypothetical protein